MLSINSNDTIISVERLSIKCKMESSVFKVNNVESSHSPEARNYSFRLTQAAHTYFKLLPTVPGSPGGPGGPW